MRACVFRVCLWGVTLFGTGAAVSSAIAYACTSTGCSSGCKASAKWCNTALDVGWDFGASQVALGGSCSLSPEGGFAIGFAMRSCDVYDGCSSECPSDNLGPGTMTGTRETTSQGWYYTQCYVPAP